jgi:hypothetical protein
MRRGRTVKAVAHRSEAGVASSREFLERLGRILVHSGHSPKRLEREFREVCAGMKEPDEAWDPSRVHYFFDLPHVIAHWYSDPQYVDSRGSPLALPLQTRGPSLSALVSRVLPHARTSDVVSSLVRLGAVRRRGSLYTPTDRYLAFNQQRMGVVVHGLTALLGMLRTVEHNLSNRHGETVLERAAMNPHFPVTALPAFHRRLKQLASEFLFTIDGDMRRRERRAGGSTTRLGVGVFAFEDPLHTGVGRRRAQRPQRKSAKTGAR